MWLNGFGFPRYRGGLMFWADDDRRRARSTTRSPPGTSATASAGRPSPLLRRLAETGTPLREAKPGRPM